MTLIVGLLSQQHGRSGIISWDGETNMILPEGLHSASINQKTRVLVFVNHMPVYNGRFHYLVQQKYFLLGIFYLILRLLLRRVPHTLDCPLLDMVRLTFLVLSEHKQRSTSAWLKH